MTHTPGPWRIFGGYREGFVRIDAGAVLPNGDPDTEKDGITLFCSEELRCYKPEAYKEEMANFRLVSAAPELLEALKNAVARLDAHEGPDDNADLRAAIAKAEGRK